MSVFVGAVPPWLPQANRGSHGGTAPTVFVKQLRGFDISLTYHKIFKNRRGDSTTETLRDRIPSDNLGSKHKLP